MKLEPNPIDVLLADCEAQLRRRGKDGGDSWCYLCGVSGVALSRCDCGLSESLRCGKSKVCDDCRDAHRKIASQLELMFMAKRTARANSRRSRLYRQIREACESLGPEGQRLRSRLGREACPYGDEEKQFRVNVLGAFTGSGFLDFVGLAKAIDEQQRIELAFAISRSGILDL